MSRGTTQAASERGAKRASAAWMCERRDGALVLSARHLAQMKRYARRAYPEECCGILVGVRRHGRVTVSSVHPATNRSPERRRDRYQVDPTEILRLHRAGEEAGQEIVGFYHSHPDHPPFPSATDAEQAWPAYAYVIVALGARGGAEVRAWTYDEGTRRFHERPIKAPGAQLGRSGQQRRAMNTVR